MNIKDLANNELVKLCAQHLNNRSAWMEFYARFDERIWLVTYRECKQKRIIEHSVPFRQIVPDLVQDVYVRLVENNCKALRDFIGASENSIYTYIGIIAKNVVRNYLIKMGAQKRPAIDKSIDDIQSISKNWISKDKLNIVLNDREEDLKEQIEVILDRQLKGRDKERNKLIFKLYMYEGFSPEEIALQKKFSLSAKRIGNIISEIKKELRYQLLEQKMEVY